MGASQSVSGRGAMASSAPTILRTEHKFGDYLSQPDLARFELPRKMSRPWIVNKTYETEKMEHIRGTEDSGDKKNVFHKIKQSKNEKRKMVGGNKKYVRNINDIIASDHDNVTAVNTNITTTTNTPVLADNHRITWNTHHQTKQRKPTARRMMMKWTRGRRAWRGTSSW